MAVIVPAILEKTYENFLVTYNQEVKLPGVQRVQVDFSDGVFVPTLLLPVTEIDALTPAVHWEAHLMVQEPQDFLDYKICGFNTVIVHFEAFAHKEGLLRAIESIKHHGMEPAVCINPGTPVAVLPMLEGMVKHFQVMGVLPGAQGQMFIEGTLGKIRELRRLIPNAIIELDGGMNTTNILAIAEAGADLIIAGSSLTKSQNMAEAYDKLIAELNRSV